MKATAAVGYSIYPMTCHRPTIYLKSLDGNFEWALPHGSGGYIHSLGSYLKDVYPAFHDEALRDFGSLQTIGPVELDEGDLLHLGIYRSIDTDVAQARVMGIVSD